MQDERVVIRGGVAGLVAAGGGKDVDGGSPEGHGLSGRERTDSSAERCGFLKKLLVGGAGRIVAHPELARAEVAQHRGYAPHVVAMCVGEHDHIEAMELPAPEVWGHDILADIEITLK